MSLIAELRRRNVFRVGAAYAIVAWLLIEVASVILPALRLPEWTLTFLVFLVAVGFPLALIFAWAFELTPEGIKREANVDRAESITHRTGRKLDFAIIGLLAIAVVYLAVDKFVLEAEPEQPSVAREKSIAVLPFANISPDPEDAYFADGIHDEVLAQLSKIRDLKVISRTSVMGYKGESRPPLPKIAAELGVANILEGSVRLAGNQVRITTQLIEAESDTHLWTETYDRELTAANIFSIQSDVAKTVANALQAALSPQEEHQLNTVPTENMAALKAYFLGTQRLAREPAAAAVEAVDYFQRAMELDPGFALAYVGLADSYSLQMYLGSLASEEGLKRAQAAADKALALDDQLGETHKSLAQIKWWKGDEEGAELAFRRALELNPNYVPAYTSYSDLLRIELDRYEESLTLLRKAAELDPLSAAVIHRPGHALDALGRFDEALAWLERALEVDPSYAHTYITILAWLERALEVDPSYAHTYITIGEHYALVSGRLDEAVVWYARGISLDPGNPLDSSALGMLFLDLGDFDRAESWIGQSIELGPESVWPNIAMQLLHLYRDEEALALDYARRAFALDPLFVPLLLRDHELRAGRYPEARALYEKSYPELLKDDDPKVGSMNYQPAIDLALVLAKSGEQDRADLLLNRSLQYIQTLPRLGEAGYGIADVEIYALQGDKQKALSALRQAIDEGWRTLWWYFLKRDLSLESLHGEPEFQAMIAEIETDMAAQLKRVREMERRGGLAFPAELPVPRDRAMGSSPRDLQ
jgi:TolB-like protein/cytochrome c-type biogenesis protein CcmH/NrfG